MAINSPLKTHFQDRSFYSIYQSSFYLQTIHNKKYTAAVLPDIPDTVVWESRVYNASAMPG